MSIHERLRRKRLGDVLVDEGAASKEAVITALHESQHSQQLLSDILIAGHELREYDLAQALVRQYQMPYIELAGYNFHRDLIARFPPDLLNTNGVIPLDQFGECVCFACQEFPAEEVEKQLAEHSKGRVFFFAALAMSIRQALADHAPRPQAEEEAGDEPVATAALVEDTTWKGLFDTANESILSSLGEEVGEADTGGENEPPPES